METENCNKKYTILMFPWLAHGHIFPYLELSKAILKRKNFHIYLCSTAINFDSINEFVCSNSLHDSVELVELHLDSSELPPHYHTTKNLPSSLNLTLIKAFQNSNSSFADIIMKTRPDLVIYDVFQPWASKIALSQGIPSVHFSIFGAVFLSFVHHEYTFLEAGFPFPEIQFEEHELRSVRSFIKFLFANIHDVDQDFLFGNFKQSRDVVLVKTSRGIEGKYIDYLSHLSNKKIVHVGSLITHATKIDAEMESDIMQWLSKKTEHSTLFISFGSEYFLSKNEIEEIAKGLELFEVNFIWIIRFPVGKTISVNEVLPKGFLNRVGDRGIIATGWAPQASILAHRNTGGFVSHCGWSSVTESMYFGVPVIGMPMKLDQPINARMLAAAGSCVEVRRNENEGFKGEEIAEAIKKVVVDGSGEGLRRRARELSETTKMETEHALDDVAEELLKLCSMKK